MMRTASRLWGIVQECNSDGPSLLSNRRFGNTYQDRSAQSCQKCPAKVLPNGAARSCGPESNLTIVYGGELVDFGRKFHLEKVLTTSF